MGFFSKLFGKKKVKQPEDDYIVTITDLLIKIEHPRRETEQINWLDITDIKYINTDEGPFVPDIWLVLFGKENGCLIPVGTEGYDEIYEIVSGYENFNYDNVIKSMSCTENAEFHLWSKKSLKGDD